METLKIMSGFKDIADELRKRSDKKSDAEPIQLWFTFKHGMLVVHNAHNHNHSLLLAIKIGTEWKIFLKPGSNGEALINYATKTEKNTSIEIFINKLYKTHGHVY